MSEGLLEREVLERHLDGMSKLVEITCALAAEHDLDRILETVTSGACAALECERASLFLHDAQRGELYTRVVTELEIEEIRSSIQSGITGWVARRRQIANIPHPALDARWNSSVDRKTGFQTRNILAAPVVSSHDDRLLGVLQALNKQAGCFDEIDERLIQAFAAHAATALQRAELLESARRSQALQISVEMGKQIQRSFLPAQLPEIPGYEVAAWWEPAEAVSGDYYDILPLPDGRLGLVVADVSGHGIGPSLIMAEVRAMLHVLTRTISAPDRILELLAETLLPDLQDGRFVTLLMGALDPRAHRLSYANAGHGPAFHLCRRTGQFRALDSTALPLGFAEEAGIPCGEPISLEPGDLVLLATDGAIELRDEHDRMFGRQRLEQLVCENRRRPATEILGVLREAICRFHPHQHPPDDVTVMVLERKRHG